MQAARKKRECVASFWKPFAVTMARLVSMRDLSLKTWIGTA